MAEASAQIITNRTRFTNGLADSEMALRSMARTSRFPKDMCQLFEDEANRLAVLIKTVKDRISETV